MDEKKRFWILLALLALSIALLFYLNRSSGKLFIG
jgi:hypothetical protein